MPKYNFDCESCNYSTHRYVSTSITVLDCPKCGKSMIRQLPHISGNTEVREVVDAYTNTKWSKDHEAVIKKRKEDHYWEIEVPRLVEKYSVETCLEQGWLIYNDKGELVINKPPSRR